MFLEGGSSPFQPDDEHFPVSFTSSSTPKPMRTITVSAVNKTVQLPENKVKLSAYTVPYGKLPSTIFILKRNGMDYNKLFFCNFQERTIIMSGYCYPNLEVRIMLAQ